MLQFAPEFIVHNFQILVEYLHAAHDSLFGLIHVLDVHVDEEGHEAGEHEEDLRFGVNGVLLELEVVQRSQYLIHST